MEELKTLDQFRVWDDQSIVRNHLDIAVAKRGISNARLEILSAVDYYLSIGGAEQPLETISLLITNIAYYRESIAKLFEEHPDIADKYFDELPRGLSGNEMYAIFELIKFINKIEFLTSQVDRFGTRAETLTYLQGSKGTTV